MFIKCAGPPTHSLRPSPLRPVAAAELTLLLFLLCSFSDNTNLDGMDFSPFAQVVEGMDVVDRIFKIGEKPDQGRIQAEGNKYLKKEFPRLTCVFPSLAPPLQARR